MRKHVFFTTGLLVLAGAQGCTAAPARTVDREVAGIQRRTPEERAEERKKTEAERETSRAERMRKRVLRKLARYHLSDEFLREREVLGALLLRNELEKIVPKTRDEVRALLVTEEGRVRALLAQDQWKPDIRDKLEAYLKALAKIVAQRRSQVRAETGPTGPIITPDPDDDDNHGSGDGDFGPDQTEK